MNTECLSARERHARPYTFVATVCLIISVFSFPFSAFPQGSLTPPGAPAPTMKTLDQIEPRTAVQTLTGDATAQFVISQPGSYYLTGGISGVSGKAAIAITADSVTLDLSGQVLTGVGGATNGIEIRGARNQLVIRNGHIRSFDTSGISAASGVSNLRIEGVTVTLISAGIGISLPAGSTNELVSACTVSRITGGGGISIATTGGTVTHCVVKDCNGSSTMTGISAQNVIGCEVTDVSLSSGSTVNGIFATSVSDCGVTSVSNTSTGAATGINASTVRDCTINSVTTQSGASTGIMGHVISHSDVATIGNAGSTSGATGLSGIVVTSCRVSSVIGGTAGSTIGISASEVSQCSVNTVTQTSGTGIATGISAEVITDCRVNAIASGASGDVSGLSNYRIARSCSVVTVTASGSGQTLGASTTSAGRTEAVAVSGTMDVGISVSTGQTVTGCTTANETTGILATGSRNVIDGNNIIGSSTTGISATSGSNTANALIVRNQIRNCTTNIQPDSPCQVGPSINAAGVIAAGANPWANFTD